MSLNGSAQVRAEEILGHWLTEKGDAHVLIYIERDMYVGKIVWVKDEKQSAQLNTVILADFVYDEKEKEWNSGTVFEPPAWPQVIWLSRIERCEHPQGNRL
ncbi:MAG: DUF2147 domain-containing protein [Cyclobacteriaceae bacterium]|nr:DUF2147 domain-containing protein [Cyclobacteriaceae bacterium]